MPSIAKRARTLAEFSKTDSFLITEQLVAYPPDCLDGTATIFSETQFLPDVTDMHIETANILHNATSNSLVLMDEIGRGTSTYDGLSLAWACAEHLANTIGAYTLFATHYFELTQLPEQLAGVANVHLDAMEHGDTIAFMHAVQEGAASRSYGLQVAALAGVPKRVIQQARHKLLELEQHGHTEQSPPGPTSAAPHQETVASVNPALEYLQKVDPDMLTPRQAMEVLYRLRELLE